MNIAVVDDNNDDRKKLCQFVDTYFADSLVKYAVKSYISGEEFLADDNVSQIDVAFLDIFMDEISGVEVARKIREKNEKCIIVFQSTSNNFAAESYEVGALQYLIKPYEYKNFAQIMQKIGEKIQHNAWYFDLQQKGETKRIMLSKIIFVDYSNHYVQIHTRDEVVKSYVVTFQEVSNTLMNYPNFVWSYRNLLINMDKVDKIDGNFFVMTNKDTLPINRDKAKEIKQQYHTYIFRKIEGGF
ncbi:MAG: LytTR family DNA-binding domain-containing protein [Clostridia bacterium]